MLGRACDQLMTGSGYGHGAFDTLTGEPAAKACLVLGQLGKIGVPNYDPGLPATMARRVCKSRDAYADYEMAEMTRHSGDAFLLNGYERHALIGPEAPDGLTPEQVFGTACQTPSPLKLQLGEDLRRAGAPEVRKGLEEAERERCSAFQPDVDAFNAPSPARRRGRPPASSSR